MKQCYCSKSWHDFELFCLSRRFLADCVLVLLVRIRRYSYFHSSFFFSIIPCTSHQTQTMQTLGATLGALGTHLKFVAAHGGSAHTVSTTMSTTILSHISVEISTSLWIQALPWFPNLCGWECPQSHRLHPLLVTATLAPALACLSGVTGPQSGGPNRSTQIGIL